MKKLFVLIALLLSLSFTSALSLEMKDSFNQDELLMAKISGDIVQPPLKENIFLYRGHVRTAIDARIGKIGNDYYLFASLSGKSPENYTLVVENVQYMRGSSALTENLEKNFTLTENLTDFSLNKGFVITKANFDVELYNFLDDNLDLEMQITTLVGEKGGIANYQEDEENEIVLRPGSKTINFEIKDITEPTIKIINISSVEKTTEPGLFGSSTKTMQKTSYSIPVYIYVDDTSEQTKYYAFDIFCQDCEDIKLPVGGDTTKLIYIYNQGTGTLTDIKLTLSESFEPYIHLSEKSFGQILPNSNANLNMSILAGAEKAISGKLFVETAQGVSNSIPIKIDVKQGYEEQEETPVLQSTKTCAELQGKICKKDIEECKESTKETILGKDGKCCFGTCVKKSKGSLPKIIGWSLVIIMIAIGAWFFLKKYRGVKSPINLLEQSKPKH